MAVVLMSSGSATPLSLLYPLQDLASEALLPLWGEADPLPLRRYTIGVDNEQLPSGGAVALTALAVVPVIVQPT